ncbi:MAG: 5'-nucleotidase C-terminal domain-containing protein [Coleofasciculus sp. F4-SAH-05]
MKKVYPYDGPLYKVRLTGTQLLKLFNHVMRAENRIPGESNCFQVNQGVQAVYSDAEQKVETLVVNGKPVEEDTQYSVCLQEYHYKNSVQSLNMTSEELGSPKVITTSAQNVLEEYLGSHQLLDAKVEGRLSWSISSKLLSKRYRSKLVSFSIIRPAIW